ncbi:hypothetical protein MRB53_003497 [Persea americana]|uniref:Uncharacterized protein n=1 Tax=Persea americana TaxID=3435 RepID=A0ACC2MZ61_PERAE|nr:hypothetical protein MRB53_003497 [Persea americana]
MCPVLPSVAVNVPWPTRPGVISFPSIFLLLPHSLQPQTHNTSQIRNFVLVHSITRRIIVQLRQKRVDTNGYCGRCCIIRVGLRQSFHHVPSVIWGSEWCLDANGSLSIEKKVKVVFVLGGPGSGKGTQCANIVEHFGYTHLSAGDLLRAEIKSGSENGTMIQNMITEGKIVPSEVTIKLLQRAMLESENDKFLIDGFPRNEENRAAFERVTKIVPEFVLFFDCAEEEMELRLLNRNQGRVDDNIETIRKRFKVFVESSLPVIEYYSSRGKVRKIDAGRSVEEVFEAVKSIFSSATVVA